MKNYTLTAIYAIALLSLCIASDGNAAESGSSISGKITKDDADFARDAATGGTAEVQLGQIAGERATSPEVKDFGRRMQKDHSKANDELKNIASKKDIKLPSQLEGKHKATVDRLSNLKGRDFDREYMSAMVNDHKETVEKFERASDKGKDPEIRKFAKDHVPILKKHLELAEQTQKKVGEK